MLARILQDEGDAFALAFEPLPPLLQSSDLLTSLTADPDAEGP